MTGYCIHENTGNRAWRHRIPVHRFIDDLPFEKMNTFRYVNIGIMQPRLIAGGFTIICSWHLIYGQPVPGGCFRRLHVTWWQSDFGVYTYMFEIICPKVFFPEKLFAILHQHVWMRYSWLQGSGRYLEIKRSWSTQTSSVKSVAVHLKSWRCQAYIQTCTGFKRFEPTEFFMCNTQCVLMSCTG